MSSPVIIDLTKASIHELKHALATSSMTSVELVSRYLHRIAKYDMRGPGLNSVPVINYNVMEEAQASDDYRASGKPPRPLEGIPFTVKDSFRVRGMTVAAGSPAFQNLIAPDDALVVQLLRQAGAIVLDLFDILNEIVADDPGTRDLDFWRGQKFVPIPLASTLRPLDYHMLEDASALQVEDLRTLGATVVETDFPLLEQYAKQDFPGQSINVPGLSKEWTSLERCQLMAMGWDDFLRDLNDSQCPNLTHVDMQAIHPHIAPLDDPSGHSASQNQVRYSEMLEEIRIRGGSTYDLPACRESLPVLEDFRTSMYDDWMDSNCYDLLAFPTNGDVSRADADENIESMLHALQTGINYANGGRAL
ncbi:hypothetical protein E4T48_08169 [Aureobasidium sp. EXF-10727]|nr:hypothetical protein E4T48_08169 [Aureobasidium sp. EXF-10727]